MSGGKVNARGKEKCCPGSRPGAERGLLLCKDASAPAGAGDGHGLGHGSAGRRTGGRIALGGAARDRDLGQAVRSYQSQRPRLQHGDDRKGLPPCRQSPQRRVPTQRRTLYLPPAGRGAAGAGSGHGLGKHRRRPAARRGGGHPHHAGRPESRIRRRSGSAGGRRDQADQDQLFQHRGAAGRKPAQDAAGYEPRRPRDDHQAVRPAAQHAHRRCMAGAEAPRQGP